MICLEIDPGLEKRLDKLCEITGRGKDEFIREALVEFLEDREDILIATSRSKDANDPVIDDQEMRRRLGLED